MSVAAEIVVVLFLFEYEPGAEIDCISADETAGYRGAAVSIVRQDGWKN